MFLEIMILGLLFMYFCLWSDYMKILIFLELVSLMFLMLIIFAMKLDYFSLNYFFSCMIFLVCESSMGFLLFIFYISLESEVVKKMVLTQF